jgi:tRNA threonylcarbamoyladenosine biosynthesis protein TsaB
MVSVLIDCSNVNLAVGLAKDHVIIAKSEHEAWQQQSELLVAELDKLLKKTHLTRADLNEVVVSKGPGSYTGVRIALSVAKVLSFALNAPLFLASSLEMMKDPSKPTICLVNARSKRSYIGIYDGDKEILKDTIWDNTEVLSYIHDHPEDVVSGDVAYLNLEGRTIDVLENLNKADTEKNLAKEPLAAKPVYLKDNYPV